LDKSRLPAPVAAQAAPMTPFGVLARRIDRLSDRKFALASFAPGLILVGCIVVPPIMAVLVMSLFRIELLKRGPSSFIDIGNYTRAFQDADFIDTIPRTVLFAALSTAIAVPLALACAQLLNRSFRGVTILGVLLLLPWAIAPVVTGVYWRFIFQGNFGLVNGILEAAGVDNPPIWLNSGEMAMGVAIVANVWRSLPLLALILLAALKGIPQSLYRAARMDGARGAQTFRYVTLPGITNALIVVVILELIVSLQVFDIIFTLTGGGPGDQTRVISYHVYLRAFADLSFGYSAAMAVILLVITAVFSVFLIYPVVRRRAGKPVEPS
jgi:ABC-type sugar transport system permease subunit